MSHHIIIILKMDGGLYELQGAGIGSQIASGVFGHIFNTATVKIYLYTAVFFAIAYFLIKLIKHHEFPSVGSVIMQLCALCVCTILIAGLGVSNPPISMLLTAILVCCMLSVLLHMIRS